MWLDRADEAIERVVEESSTYVIWPSLCAYTHGSRAIFRLTAWSDRRFEFGLRRNGLRFHMEDEGRQHHEQSEGIDQSLMRRRPHGDRQIKHGLLVVAQVLGGVQTIATRQSISLLKSSAETR